MHTGDHAAGRQSASGTRNAGNRTQHKAGHPQVLTISKRNPTSHSAPSAVTE